MHWGTTILPLKESGWNPIKTAETLGKIIVIMKRPKEINIFNSSHRIKQGGIRRKIFLSLLVLILLIVGGIFIVVERNNRKIILNEAKKRAISNALYLAALSKAPLLMYDYTKLEQNVDEVVKETNVIYAIILDRDGRVAAHSKRDDLIGEKLKDPVSSKAISTRTILIQETTEPGLKQNIWDVSYPIYIQNERWGTIRIGFSKLDLEREIQQNVKNLIIITLIAVIIAIFAASFLASRITVPILKLSETAFLISQGKPGEKISVKTGDEVEILAKSFNKMIEDLKKNQIAREKLIQELKKSNLQLKNEISTRKQLEEEIVKMERLRALGQMSGGIAHDFNNILGGILGHTQLLMNSVADQKILKTLKIIEKAALDGAETVRRIQEFSRIRQDTNKFTSLDINVILKDSIEFTVTKWKSEAQLRGIHIDIVEDYEPDIYVKGEASGLREVFTNLIINAVDAMPHGGKIVIKTEKSNNRALISISDSGIGMSDETKKRIFDPFFTTKGVRGNGLGLSICYGIIMRHNGSIEVESSEGIGTVFRIFLPLSEVPDKGLKISAITQNLPPSRILVIDDDPVILSLINDVLEQSGCSVTTIKEGRRGIEILKDRDFDLLLLDLGLEDISGWDVVEEIRKTKKNMKIILITGWGGQISDNQVKRFRINYVISKPFRINELKERILESLCS